MTSIFTFVGHALARDLLQPFLDATAEDAAPVLGAPEHVKGTLEVMSRFERKVTDA